MLQIAYFSTATVAQTKSLVEDILTVARAHNARTSITGLLVAGGNRYMQIIEGPRVQVETLWAAILRDERHCAVTELVNRRATARLFGSWSMAFQSEQRLSDFHTFPQTLRFLVKQIEDPKLRGQLERYGRSFIQPAGGSAPTPWE
ncbi:hypothetical protein BH24PSE1_BH24PSE1_11760 [soil metagenome]